MEQPPMTPKQAAFCDQYLIDHNATQAAIRAGYSARTAAQQGVELLARPLVQQAIAAGQTVAQQRNALTVGSLLNELEDARQQARGEGQCSAMVSATMAKAKILGLDKPQPQPPADQGQITVTVIRAKKPDANQDMIGTYS
jgi:phage terminase small subunit